MWVLTTPEALTFVTLVVVLVAMLGVIGVHLDWRQRTRSEYRRQSGERPSGEAVQASEPTRGYWTHPDPAKRAQRARAAARGSRG